MRSINEYLLGKRKKISFKFPKTPKIDYVVDFLKENGFEEVNDKEFFNVESLDKSIYFLDGEVFGITPVFFCKKGKICEKNPVIWVMCTKDGSIQEKYIAGGYRTSFTEAESIR